MQDHPDIPSAPPYGLRPETWAVAEYDALREALSVLLARVTALTYAAIAKSEDPSLDAPTRASLRDKVRDLRALDNRIIEVRNAGLANELLRERYYSFAACVQGIDNRPMAARPIVSKTSAEIEVGRARGSETIRSARQPQPFDIPGFHSPE